MAAKKDSSHSAYSKLLLKAVRFFAASKFAFGLPSFRIEMKMKLNCDELVNYLLLCLLAALQ